MTENLRTLIKELRDRAKRTRACAYRADRTSDLNAELKQAKWYDDEADRLERGLRTE
jgi:hypothetical protein